MIKISTNKYEGIEYVVNFDSTTGGFVVNLEGDDIKASTFEYVIVKAKTYIENIVRQRGYRSPTLNNFVQNLLREIKDYEGDALYDFITEWDMDEDGVKAVFNSMSDSLLADLGLKRI